MFKFPLHSLCCPFIIRNLLKAFRDVIPIKTRQMAVQERDIARASIDPQTSHPSRRFKVMAGAINTKQMSFFMNSRSLRKCIPNVTLLIYGNLFAECHGYSTHFVLNFNFSVHGGDGIINQYSNWLRAGRPRDQLPIPERTRIISSSRRPEWFWGPPRLLSNRYREVFIRG
jgi:hypothetical protein